MLTRQLRDPTVLLQRAKEQGVPVKVLRSASVVPSEEQGSIVMRPVVLLRYSAVVEPKSGTEKEEWIYEEVRTEDERGEIKEDDTFLKKLRESEVKVTTVFRSGSMG